MQSAIAISNWRCNISLVSCYSSVKFSDIKNIYALKWKCYFEIQMKWWYTSGASNKEHFTVGTLGAFGFSLKATQPGDIVLFKSMLLSLSGLRCNCHTALIWSFPPTDFLDVATGDLIETSPVSVLTSGFSLVVKLVMVICFSGPFAGRWPIKGAIILNDQSSKQTSVAELFRWWPNLHMSRRTYDGGLKMHCCGSEHVARRTLLWATLLVPCHSFQGTEIHLKIGYP